MAQAEEAKLIRLVENFPAIYDINHIDNKNPIAISSMWEIITEDCYAKWKYLRRRFTGCSVPTSWPHYEAMKFLEPYITRRKKKHGVDEEETITVADVSPPSKKRKRETGETEESIKLFCQSISGDLLQLSTEKQMEVRIKIMILLQKYLSNSDQSNESDDTLVAKIMETFSQIEKKIVRQKMPETDPDWLFVYCIKNVFSNMMSLRLHSNELQNVLHEFEVVEKFHEDEGFDDVKPVTVKKEKLPRETKAALIIKPTKELRKHNEQCVEDVILIEDEPLIKKERVAGQIAKEERKYTEKEPVVTRETKSAPSTSANIREPKSTAHQSERVVLVENGPVAEMRKEPVNPTNCMAAFDKPTKTSADTYKKVNNRIIRRPYTLSSMMKQISSNGIEKKFCNICDIKIEDNSHINTDAHITASKKCHLPYGIYILNPVLFEFANNMPTCIPCEETFNRWWDLKDHIFMNKTKHSQYFSSRPVPNPEKELLRFIRNGVFSFGNSFAYCFVCDKHCDDESHVEEDHFQNLMQTRAFCRLLDDVYCFCCNEVFSIVRLVKHKNKKDHKMKFAQYYAGIETGRGKLKF